MLLLILAVLGCEPAQTEPMDTGEPRTDCLALEPAVVEFDDVELTVDPWGVATVTLVNACDRVLDLDDIRLEDPDSPFSISAWQPWILASSSTELTIGFEPLSLGVYQTHLEVEARGQLERVVLSGQGLVPVLEVEADDCDFDALIGCHQECPVTLFNAGNTVLEINDMDFATGSEEFELDENHAVNGELPFYIQPGELLEGYIRYQGLDERADTAFLTIESNDPYTPEVVVTATGTATLYGKNLDEYEQVMESSTDIIFTLDRSGSMSGFMALVTPNLGTFINTMVALDADYHVAVVVEDDGCVLGSDAYIDNTFSALEAETTLETMADIDGTPGSLTEAGFELAEAALDPVNTGPGGCNEGLYRESAYLSLVHISDTSDQSTSPYSAYVSHFQGMKADPDYMVINAVAGDYPSGCGTASGGKGYYEATVATGGLFLSICATDWGSHLERIAEASVAINGHFELTQLPVPEAIEVTVDDIRTTTGWEYDAALNSVDFERDHIPADGSRIEIEYHLMPECGP